MKLVVLCLNNTMQFYIVSTLSVKYLQSYELHKKWSFPLRISLVHVTQSAKNLVTFTGEILNGKLTLLHQIFNYKNEGQYFRKDCSKKASKNFIKWYKVYNNNLSVVLESNKGDEGRVRTLKLVNPKHEDWVSIQLQTSQS